MAAFALLVSTGATLTASPQQSTNANPSEQRALLDKYCVSCHNEKLKTAGLLLDKADVSHVADNAELWEKVIRKLRAGAMPPAGIPRPPEAQLNSLAGWLENTIDTAAAAKPNPGAPVAHRLNRAEYANAIRDLLALNVDVASLLPPDDSSYGFDNIADVLGVSPALVERYLAASRKISRVAVGDTSIRPVAATYRARPDLSQSEHMEGLPIGTRGGLLVKHDFPVDGEYIISVKLAGNTVDVTKGLEERHNLEIGLDRKRVFLSSVGGPEDTVAATENPQATAQAIAKRLSLRIPIQAGEREVSVAFLKKTSAESDLLLQPFLRSTLDPVDESGLPHVAAVTITGPYEANGAGDTPTRKRIFVCKPAKGSDEIPCARKILTTLARRAYRRPLTDADTETLLSFYQSGRNDNGSFDSGIESGLRRILASPDFLFRFEPDPAGETADSIYRISDLDLASRLSFFLWSSVPDEQLLTLATQGKLKDPNVLEQQVKRMLADSRADAMVENFAGQWLYLRNLKSVAPDIEEYPNFDDNLRQAFRRETEMLFSSIVREDRNVLDLLTADYTFVNERLARHYKIPGVYGDQFRRVAVTDDARRGLLGQGSILTVTSYATRTSPVLRGKWVMENILGTPPPPPPPNVPPLKETAKDARPQSMRERMEEHRKNPACAVCHKMMDPLGFTLENFDGIGEWRSLEHGTAIDASGQTIDGVKVSGPVDLRNQLLKRPEGFVTVIAEKLLTYALGRGVQYYDMPTVRRIVHDAARNDYRFSTLVMGIVKSTPFQMKIKRSQEVEGRETAGVIRP